MPRKPGSQKSGGRKAGTPNKKTQSLEDKAREMEVDPFEILLRVAKGDWRGLGYKENVISLETRLKAASEACTYLFPKRKAIQITAPFDPDVDRPLKGWSDEDLDNFDEDAI